MPPSDQKVEERLQTWPPFQYKATLHSWNYCTNDLDDMPRKLNALNSHQNARIHIALAIHNVTE